MPCWHIEPTTAAFGAAINEGKTMYHGSRSVITEITASGMFGGVFATSCKRAALSHGEALHEIESPRPLTDFELNYSAELGAYEVALEIAGGSAELADAIMNIECPEACGLDGWDVQRLRGKLASNLGYTSIEMLDEHGTTYLCLPGCTIKAI